MSDRQNRIMFCMTSVFGYRFWRALYRSAGFSNGYSKLCCITLCAIILYYIHFIRSLSLIFLYGCRLYRVKLYYIMLYHMLLCIEGRRRLSFLVTPPR